MVAVHGNFEFVEVCDFLIRAWELDMRPQDFNIKYPDCENTVRILDPMTIGCALTDNSSLKLNLQVELPVQCLGKEIGPGSRVRTSNEAQPKPLQFTSRTIKCCSTFGNHRSEFEARDHDIWIHCRGFDKRAPKVPAWHVGSHSEICSQTVHDKAFEGILL